MKQNFSFAHLFKNSEVESRPYCQHHTTFPFPIHLYGLTLWLPIRLLISGWDFRNISDSSSTSFRSVYVPGKIDLALKAYQAKGTFSQNAIENKKNDLKNILHSANSIFSTNIFSLLRHDTIRLFASYLIDKAGWKCYTLPIKF